ncbi:hypothetical protein llap_4361 [Limosa lapponica baueri]|uniref:Uncharacterized protein n=1 Tax=Limosa lapponica baueri TaxID=1758121 RepID=A0A2I0UH09_LIMLA|nr:hypothetical protein llap_4361 [Limosa lapponica baueri]
MVAVAGKGSRQNEHPGLAVMDLTQWEFASRPGNFEEFLVLIISLLLKHPSNAGANIACRAALNPSSAQTVLVLGIAVTHVQHLILGLVELQEVCMGPPLKPVQSLWMASLPSSATQLGVVSKLAEGALNPTVHVTGKDVKQHQSHY